MTPEAAKRQDIAQTLPTYGFFKFVCALLITELIIRRYNVFFLNGYSGGIYDAILLFTSQLCCRFCTLNPFGADRTGGGVTHGSAVRGRARMDADGLRQRQGAGGR